MKTSILQSSTSNRSLEDLYYFSLKSENGVYSTESLGKDNSLSNQQRVQYRIKNRFLEDCLPKRRSKSEIHLNVLLYKESEGRKDSTNTKFNKSIDKTGDLLVKALKDTIEDKQKDLRKSDLGCEENNYNSLNNSTEDHLEKDDNSMMMPISSHPAPSSVVTDSQGLIVPKKLINPCQESSDRKNLHRELLFNQKIGKNVLNQKSELQRALEKQKEKQLMLQQQQQQQQQGREPINLKGELNRVIMERAQKIEKKNNETNQSEIDSQLNQEYLNARAKLRTRIDSK